MRLMQRPMVAGRHFDHGSVYGVPDAHAICAGPFPGELDGAGKVSKRQSMRVGDDADEMAPALRSNEDIPVDWAIGHGSGKACMSGARDRLKAQVSRLKSLVASPWSVVARTWGGFCS